MLKLAPLLVGRVRRGVVGSSRYARSLRDTMRQVAQENDRRPVLITGEPGLEKDNLAALIHFGSSARQQLMVRLDGALLKPDGSDLFGPGGVLELLGTGSLLIDQLEHVPEALMPRLLQLAKDGTWGEGGQHQCAARLFFTTETVRPEFDPFCTTIRVPPLRVRRGDLGEWLRYGIRQQSRKMGWSTPPDVPDSVIKRLQNYDFPNNLR
ncbi:sigma 54-interacting transcriptional regulator, partial [Vulcanococcus sp.]|uniref:sigma 54-interacting transcriptional regulator n=1 Tax=Vulcanococcus sp. TaxID=2856995 RepID=UPI003F6A05EE